MGEAGLLRVLSASRYCDVNQGGPKVSAIHRSKGHHARHHGGGGGTRCLEHLAFSTKAATHSERSPSEDGRHFACKSLSTESASFFFFFKYLFIHLFMAVLGLRFCAKAFSSCGKRGPLLIAVRGPLTIAASLVAEHRLQTHRLSNCGSRAQLLRGMWDLPRPGLEPVFPALAGRFSTTAPPGKPQSASF